LPCRKRPPPNALPSPYLEPPPKLKPSPPATVPSARLPPLIVSEADIDEIWSRFGEAIEEASVKLAAG